MEDAHPGEAALFCSSRIPQKRRIVPPKGRTLRLNRGTFRPSLLVLSATLLYREETTHPSPGLSHLASFPKPDVSTDRDKDENDLFL